MKKNILLFAIIGILISALGMNACAPDYETEFEVKSLVVPDASLAPIFFPLEGGEKVAMVQTNVDMANWTASSNAAWLVLSKAEDKVTVSAGNNDTYAPRVARVTIAYGYQSYTIDVTQGGKTPLMLVEGTRTGVVKSVSAGDTTLSLIVQSNLNLDHILVPDTGAFVHVASITDVAGSPDKKRVTFTIDQNISRKVRYSTVTFQSSDNYDHTASFVVAQAGMIFLQVPLREDMLSSNAQEPNEGPIRNLLDGNSGTFFHSAWSYSISEAHYIQVKLDAPIEGCIFWYQNRNNSNGKPTDVSIMVSADGSTWSEMAHITSGLPTGASSTYESAYYASVTPFTYFRFVVNKTNGGVAPTYFNMAEFKMFVTQ